MTFRTNCRTPGEYVVEEGGQPLFVHVDTGLRIRITRSFKVNDVKQYATRYFKEEGFDSPKEFLRYLKQLYGELPSTGYAHVFKLIKTKEAT